MLFRISAHPPGGTTAYDWETHAEHEAAALEKYREQYPTMQIVSLAPAPGAAYLYLPPKEVGAPEICVVQDSTSGKFLVQSYSALTSDWIVVDGFPSLEEAIGEALTHRD